MGGMKFGILIERRVAELAFKGDLNIFYDPQKYS